MCGPGPVCIDPFHIFQHSTELFEECKAAQGQSTCAVRDFLFFNTCCFATNKKRQHDFFVCCNFWWITLAKNIFFYSCIGQKNVDIASFAERREEKRWKKLRWRVNTKQEGKNMLNSGEEKRRKRQMRGDKKQWEV